MYTIYYSLTPFRKRIATERYLSLLMYKVQLVDQVRGTYIYVGIGIGIF